MAKKTKIVLVVLVVVLVIAIIGIYFLLNKNQGLVFEFITVEKTTLIQQVSATGKIEPKQDVDLTFEQNGKVSEVLVEVGELVVVGKKLVQLDDTQLRAQLSQHQATLDKENATLAELQFGSRPEEITLAQTKVDNAEIALKDAQISLANTESKAEADLSSEYEDGKNVLQAMYISADDAINNELDDMFDDDNTNDPDLTFSTTDTQVVNETELGRATANLALERMEELTNNLPDSRTELDSGLIDSRADLVIIKNFLSKLSEALNITIGVSQATLNTYKNSLNTVREAMNTEIANIDNQIQDIASQKLTNQNNINTSQASVNTAQNVLNLAIDELELKQAGSTIEQINAQKALVKVAQANIANTLAQLEKITLSSPISGVITKQEAKVGEVFPANQVVVSIISMQGFEIEIFVPEIDIAKINKGDYGEVSLDAYDSDFHLEARVASIDPAETIIEGVATYRTVLEFLVQDSRVKPGMTANVEIFTAEKQNVIAIPARAVISRNNEKIARVVKQTGGDGLTYEEVVIKTGLRGSDGNIEIIEGLQLGDQVIVYLRPSTQ